MIKKDEINESLLLKYFNNELDEDLRNEVDNWIAASEKNKQKALDYLHITSAYDAFQKEKNVDEAWDKIKFKLFNHSTKTYPLYFKYTRLCAAVAALAIILIISWYNWPAKVEIKPSLVEVRMSPGMTGHIVLPDSSEVWLNSNSLIRYSSNFCEDNRNIFLDGEAYFLVKKYNNTKFIVSTSVTRTEVLGTEFNIDAYSHFDKVTTTLVNGAVKLSYKDESDKIITTVMEPSQQVIYDKVNSTTYSHILDSNRELSWKEGRIILRDTQLKDILWILEKRFNMDFVVKKKIFNNYSFTGSFSSQNLERILEHFKLSSGINYKIKYSINEEGEAQKGVVELY